jgi:hypothetical protein
VAYGCLDLFHRWNNPNTTLRRLYLLFRKSKSARTYPQFPSLNPHVYTSCRLYPYSLNTAAISSISKNCLRNTMSYCIFSCICRKLLFLYFSSMIFNWYANTTNVKKQVLDDSTKQELFSQFLRSSREQHWE